MSLLGGLYKGFNASGSVARIRTGFPDDFESSSVVSVLTKQSVPNGAENWVWNLCYANALFVLGKCECADDLNNTLEEWATEWAAALVGGSPLPPLETLAIDKDLELRPVLKNAEEYVIDVISSGERTEGFEMIQTRLPDGGGHQNRIAYAVVALAHYFMAEADEGFSRMLPVHILAMNTYYRKQADYDQVESILGAPSFAMRKETRIRDEVVRAAN